MFNEEEAEKIMEKFEHQDSHADFDLPDSLEELFQSGEEDPILSILFNNPDVRTITDLTPAEVRFLAVGLVIGRHTRCSALLEFLDNFMNLKISVNRASRKEAVAIKTSENVGFMPEEAPKGLIQKIKEAVL